MRRGTRACEASRLIIYFDTSFLVPLVLSASTSDQIGEFIRALPAEEFAVSHWTRVEFSSLIAREVRMGGLDPETAIQADARFEAMLEESFAVLLPNPGDFDLAKEYLGNFETGLRAGDALIWRSRGTIAPRRSTPLTTPFSKQERSWAYR